MAALRTEQLTHDKEYGAVLLCAGKGTRMVELTRDEIPKPLYKIEGKELVAYNMDLLRGTAVDRVVFAVNHLAQNMEDWIRQSSLPFETLSFRVNGSTATAIREGMAIVDREHVVICGGDEIVRNFNLNDMIRQHEETGSLVTILATDRKKSNGNGVLLDVEGSGVKSILRKDEEVRGSGISLCHAGIIILEQEAIQHFSLRDEAVRSGEIDMPIMRGSLKAGILIAIQ